jgi:hypothetical protein
MSHPQFTRPSRWSERATQIEKLACPGSQGRQSETEFDATSERVDSILASLFRLLPFGGDAPLEVASKSVVLGRSRYGCDVRVNHPSVSRRHCELTWMADALFVRDLDSRHGTRVNGQLIHESLLRSGDELALGARRFILELAVAEQNG